MRAKAFSPFILSSLHVFSPPLFPPSLPLLFLCLMDLLHVFVSGVCLMFSWNSFFLPQLTAVSGLRSLTLSCTCLLLWTCARYAGVFVAEKNALKLSFNVG